ncbi:MAG: hypothetical protein GY810_13245 [Aureispira sp.]|nr:hypothetical protein [Aureispira sp.]
MEVNVRLDQSPNALALSKRCTRNGSDDSDPFYMSELNILDVESLGPITKQNIYYFLYSFVLNIPIERYQKHMVPDVRNERNEGTDAYYFNFEQKKVEERLYGYLCEYKEWVRSPLKKEEYKPFMDELYAYLGKVKFFVISCGDLFKTPNYYCSNINIFVITQNEQPQTKNKVALFSFFASD